MIAALAAFGFLTAAALWLDPQEKERTHAQPPTINLWAWRRSEDLSFIDPRKVTAAVWTATLYLEENLRIQLRTNPVTMPVDTDVIAVTRLEGSGIHGIGRAREVADAIIRAGAPFEPVEYQVDFDATRTQRNFYRHLLEALRERLGDTPLSITALASWCMFDDWIQDLPINAAVPMLYRMGPEGPSIRARLAKDGRFRAPLCQGNVGYSADEPLTPVEGLERVFLFHPQAWTPERFAWFMAELPELGHREAGATSRLQASPRLPID